MVRIRSPTKFNSFKYGDRKFYHLFILERKVEMEKERLKIKGNLVDEVKSHVFIGKMVKLKFITLLWLKNMAMARSILIALFMEIR